jgi:hypothetical protein
LNLADTITRARDWTRRLHEALAAGETDAAMGLLPDRAAAMAALEDAHRSCDEATLLACRTQLQALRDDDRLLQELAARTLQVADQACRADLGGAPNGSTVYREEPTLACVDRRA